RHSLLIALFLLIGPMALLFGCGDDDPPVKPPPVIPTGMEVLNGDLYKAVMGSAEVDPALEFGVYDDDGDSLPNQWVHFRRLVGDGTFVADSVRSDTIGRATAEYVFDGSMGHAEIQAFLRDVDTVSVTMRANTLIPGTVGQAQYVLFNDRYAGVKDYNGEPASVDVDPTSWILYANYEAALGLVVVIEDVNHDEQAVDTADVLSVIVNTIYAGKTADSIGIGSTMADLRAAYGAPDTILYDPAPPAARYIRYNDLGLTIYADLTADTTIFEIHMTGIISAPKISGKIAAPVSTGVEPADHHVYRPYRR
ncbi:MAG: hypothetical protein KAU36_02550, partial [candidate division Zixibacteria bacterium]|nr:hypothetical protein [candidate division Zixibacteria bacterium]